MTIQAAIETGEYSCNNIDSSVLDESYYGVIPDISLERCQVRFGACGHRGTPLEGSFNEPHLVAITQAICDYRQTQNITGPIFLGKDTHAVSGPAHDTVLEVLAANDVPVIYQSHDGFTPTPVISHMILRYNKINPFYKAEGILLTPSHNPPEDGGLKYNRYHGGPADVHDTQWIQNRANQLMKQKSHEAKRKTYQKAVSCSTCFQYDFRHGYVTELPEVIDLDLIRDSKMSIGVDALGGASGEYWTEIADRFQIDITLYNERPDPTFSFIPPDNDGRIRPDCSSDQAVQNLVAQRDNHDVAWANDPDADRFGIVTRSEGLMNTNQYIASAIDYLFAYRQQWSQKKGVGKSIVSSEIIDRICRKHGRSVLETPVGFKWFTAALLDGQVGICGEESGGLAFLRRNGCVWTTDKDGVIAGLLAAEILAKTGRDPRQLYGDIENQVGKTFYARIDRPVTFEEKMYFSNLNFDPGDFMEWNHGVKVYQRTKAGVPFGGVKIDIKEGWFIIIPGGSENFIKIYAESFQNTDHLQELLQTAERHVDKLFEKYLAGRS